MRISSSFIKGYLTWPDWLKVHRLAHVRQQNTPFQMKFGTYTEVTDSRVDFHMPNLALIDGLQEFMFSSN